MTPDNIETFWRGLDAFNRGDLEAVPDVLHEEVEWHASLRTMLGGEGEVFRGHEEYRGFYEDLRANFSEFHVEIDEVHESAGRIVGIGRLSGRGRASGAAFETPIGYVFEFK